MVKHDQQKSTNTYIFGTEVVIVKNVEEVQDFGNMDPNLCALHK